jgi:hypothetical protein
MGSTGMRFSVRFEPSYHGIDMPAPTWVDALYRCSPSSFLNS